MELIENNPKWKTQALVLGAVAGAIIGLGTAYLMVRTAEENNPDERPQINTSDAIRTVLGVIGTMRGIASLGNNR